MGWLETQIDNLLSWKTRFGNWIYEWHEWIKDRVDLIALDVEDLVTLVNRIPDLVNTAIGDACIDVLSHVYDNYVKPLSYYVDALKMDVVDWVMSLRGDISDIQDGLVTVFDFIGHIDDIIDARIDGFKDKIIGYVEDKFISIVEHVLEQEVKK